jgi:hypothetical protein
MIDMRRSKTVKGTGKSRQPRLPIPKRPAKPRHRFGRAFLPQRIASEAFGHRSRIIGRRQALLFASWLSALRAEHHRFIVNIEMAIDRLAKVALKARLANDNATHV